MWEWLPDTLVQHIAMLALPAVLPALSRLEKRCHQSATERLAKLAALRRQPFVVAAGTIFGADGAATLQLQNKALTDASIEVFACACAAGALAQLKELYLHENKIGDVGMEAFASACAGGAMANLKTLYVNDGPLGTEHPALKAACQARDIRLP